MFFWCLHFGVEFLHLTTCQFEFTKFTQQEVSDYVQTSTHGLTIRLMLLQIFSGEACSRYQESIFTKTMGGENLFLAIKWFRGSPQVQILL